MYRRIRDLREDRDSQLWYSKLMWTNDQRCLRQTISTILKHGMNNAPGIMVIVTDKISYIF